MGDFERSLAADKFGRAKDVKKEIDFVLARKDYCGKIVNLPAGGKMSTPRGFFLSGKAYKNSAPASGRRGGFFGKKIFSKNQFFKRSFNFRKVQYRCQSGKTAANQLTDLH